MVVVFRLLPYVILVVIVLALLYYAGKRYGVWGNSNRGAHAAASRPQAPSKVPAQADAAPADVQYTLVSAIWQEARIMRENTWLYSRNSTVLLRLHIVDDTLYVERITRDAYGKRIEDGYAIVELFTFRRGKDAKPQLQDVRVKSEGPPHFELGAAHATTELVITKQLYDDRLRRLKTDMQLAVSVDD